MGIERLTLVEQAELAALLERYQGGESYADFVARITPREPVPHHIGPIADVLSAARRRPQRVCVALPPGHAKSVSLLKGVAWWLSRTPADTCAYVSYSDAQAMSKSRMAREWAVAAGVQMDRSFTGLAEWRTRQGGGLLSAGSRGKLNGQRIPGLLIYDDPYKSRDEVASETIREAIYRRFKEVALTRVQGGSAIVMHTRWSEDDLIGRLAREGWDVINLPAIAEEDDLLGRAVGEALWPEHYPVEACASGDRCGHDNHLASLRADLGPYSWNALYQGNPSPIEGGLFKRAWWSWWTEEGAPAQSRPHGCNDRPALVLPRDPKTGRFKLDWTVISVDSTFGKKGVTSDSVGLLVIGGKGLNRFVLEDWTAPRTFDETRRDVCALLSRWPAANRVLIEDAANGDAVASELRAAIGRGDIIDASGRSVIAAVDLLPPRGGKTSRANAMVGPVEAGLWHLREGASWQHDFVDEFGVFPNGQHDDRVDSASQASTHHSGGASTLLIPF